MNKAAFLSEPRYLVYGLAALTLFSTIIPIAAYMPESGLDPSWMFAMNQAVVRGIALGRELVFTFGPYAGLYTRLYDPGTDSLILFSGTILATFYTATFLRIAAGRPLLWTLGFIYIASAVLYSKDTLLTSYGLMLAVLLYRILREPYADEKRQIRVFLVLTAPMGFLPLVKGSMLPAVAGFTLLYGGFLWARRRRAAALSAALVPGAAMVGAWVVSGQSLLDLPSYLRWMLPIISGYTDAMSQPADRGDLVAFVLSAIVIVATLAVASKAARIPKLFILLSFLLFLFVTFKGGFTRFDSHVLIAGNALAIAAILLGFLGMDCRWLPLAVILALGGTYSIDLQQIGSAQEVLLGYTLKTYASAVSGLRNRLTRPGQLQAEYEAHLAAMRAELPIDAMPGSTDIYPYDQSFLLASQNTWQPRPVLQSYSAYTPSLATRDHDQLLRHAPDHIVMRVGTIDNRIPSLDDGSSWPVMLHAYAPSAFHNDTLVLQRHDAAADPAARMVQDGIFNFGDEISLQPSDDVLFARFTITKTWLGKLVSLFYKADPLKIRVKLSDGTVRTFRIVSGMTQTGFILSPLIENSAEFAYLFGDRSTLSEKTVTQFTVVPERNASPFWNRAYRLSVARLDMSRAERRPVVSPYPALTTDLPAGIRQVGAPEGCEFGVDTINGLPFGSGNFKAQRLSSITGWMTDSGRDGTLPDAVFARLSNKAGQIFYIGASRVMRSDLQAYFHHLSVGFAGFHAAFEQDQLMSGLTLGLARSRQGVLHDCNNFSIKLSDPKAPADAPSFSAAPSPTTHERLAASLQPVTMERCEGAIDRLNGAPLTHGAVVATQAITVSGWSTIDGAHGKVPDAVFITLTGADGKQRFIEAPLQQRDDVRGHFGMTSLPNVGFDVRIPLDDLSGTYRLGLSRLNSGKLETCPVALPVTVH